MYLQELWIKKEIDSVTKNKETRNLTNVTDDYYHNLTDRNTSNVILTCITLLQSVSSTTK